MGIMIEESRSFKEILSQYIIYVPLTEEYREFCAELGYSKCSGTMSKEPISYAIQPFTLKYWEDIQKPTLSVKQKTIKYLTLEGR